MGNRKQPFGYKMEFGEIVPQPQEAEAVRIQDGKHSWLVVLNHLETGADGEYIGAEGRYGLGRVMVCDEADREGRMTVLQW